MKIEKIKLEYPVCNKCLWYKGNAICLAFHDKIPSEILKGKDKHTTKYIEQKNNFIFEPIYH